MKKEDRESIQSKTEGYGEFKCLSCDQIYDTEVNFRTHKLSHLSSNDPENLRSNSLNGAMEIEESSDEKVTVLKAERKSKGDAENTAEDQMENSSAENNSSDSETMKDERNDATNDSLSLDFNVEELLTKEYKEDENSIPEASSKDRENKGSDFISNLAYSVEVDEENQNESNEQETLIPSSVNENGVPQSEVISEEEQEIIEAPVFEENTSTESQDNSNEDEINENPQDSEESEQDSKEEIEDVEVFDVKRNSSRDSTTSTTSTSSERTLTIRSASQVNQMVVERDSNNSEKPSLSILNPSQLGAVTSTNVENLLQGGSIVQSGYSKTVQNGIDSHSDGEPQFVTEFRNQQPLHGINQSPVQQLAHQVQSIPARYQMDQSSNYSNVPSYPPTQSIPPIYLAPQTKIHTRQYNTNNSARCQIGSVRSVLPNSVASVNSLKRAMPSQRLPLLPSQSKRRCNDNYIVRNGDDGKGIADDVVAQLSKSITITARQESQKKNNETAAVANLLANRGITVSSVPPKPKNNSLNPVTMLNLNSAVSLIPTTNSGSSNQNRQNSGFAVPRTANNRLPSPNRVSQTVDLTGPDLPRNKPVNRGLKNVCQICDRAFLSQEQLNQHMLMHRSPRKQLPFKCNLCGAQYPNQQGLIIHRQTCQKNMSVVNNEMVIPIVDLKQPGVLQRLQTVGINHMIPLNALGAQAANGTFGIPILPFSSDRSAVASIASIGISNILPVGPLKTLGR